MKKDIHNLKEILDLVFSTATYIITDIRKDGFQLVDLYAFLEKPEFKEKFQKAIEDIQEIPAEVLDIKGFEFVELGSFLVKKIIVLIKAIVGK